MMDGAGSSDSHRSPNGGLAEVGAMLRDRRKELGHDIQSVARQTHIKISYLSAIEEGRRRDLPGAAYTIGFVRTYADFLGFDGNRLVTDFHAQLAGARLRPAAQAAAQAAQEAPRFTVSPVMVAGAVLALALVGFFLWGYLSDNSNDTNTAAVEEAQDAPDGDGSAADETAGDASAPDAGGESATAQDGAAAPDAGAAAAATAGAADQAAPAADGAASTQQAGTAQAGADQPSPDAAGLDDQLPPPEGEPGDTANQDPEQVQQASAAEGAPTGKVVLRARLESWVQVTNAKGESVFSRVLRAGETYNVPNETGLMLTTGNAGGIEIVLDGKKLKSLGSVGLVRRDFPLDAKKLKDGSAYKPAAVSPATQ